MCLPGAAQSPCSTKRTYAPLIAAVHHQDALRTEEVRAPVLQQARQPLVEALHIAGALPGDAHAGDGAVVLVLLVLLVWLWRVCCSCG